VVNKPILLAVCAALSAGLAFSSAKAQNQPVVDRGVAVIDLRYIFEHYPKFQELKASIDADVKSQEADIKARKERLETLKKQRDSHRRVSTEYESLDNQLTRESADFQAHITNERKRIMAREATAYYTAYKEIVQEVALYAELRGFSMILRFNNDLLQEDEKGDVKEVAKHLNKPVVFLKPNLNDPNNPNSIFDPRNRDITPAILAILKHKNPGSGTAPQRATVPTRPNPR
jgi:Skp family chaperone for outer membrane proteins